MTAYNGYTSKDVAKLLRRSVEMVRRAGVLELIPKQYPFGRSFPLYSESEVQEWSIGLVRRDAEVAFGYLSPRAPLKEAIGYSDDSYDVDCPRCNRWAIGDRCASMDEYYAAVQADEWPRRVWCRECGVFDVTSADREAWRIKAKEMMSAQKVWGLPDDEQEEIEDE